GDEQDACAVAAPRDLAFVVMARRQGTCRREAVAGQIGHPDVGRMSRIDPTCAVAPIDGSGDDADVALLGLLPLLFRFLFFQILVDGPARESDSLAVGRPGSRA